MAMMDRITPALMKARDLNYETALKFVNENIHRKSESPYGGPGSTAKYMIALWDRHEQPVPIVIQIGNRFKIDGTTYKLEAFSGDTELKTIEIRLRRDDG